MKTIYLHREILKNANIRYLINLIKNKEIIEMNYGDVLINGEEYNNGYKILEDTVVILKSPKLSLKLFQAILNFKSITVIETNIYSKTEALGVIDFLDSLDEKEYNYKLIYIKSGIVSVKKIKPNSINLLIHDKKKIIKIIENNI